MAIDLKNIGNAAPAEEAPFDGAKLIEHKDKIESLVKLICYVGSEHERVRPLAEEIYDLIFSGSQTTD